MSDYSLKQHAVRLSLLGALVLALPDWVLVHKPADDLDNLNGRPHVLGIVLAKAEDNGETFLVVDRPFPSLHPYHSLSGPRHDLFLHIRYSNYNFPNCYFLEIKIQVTLKKSTYVYVKGFCVQLNWHILFNGTILLPMYWHQYNDQFLKTFLRTWSNSAYQ